MKMHIMKHLHEVLQFWEYKVVAGLFAMVFSEAFFKLLLLFLLLTLLDCYTRWVAISASLWKHTYPNSKGNLWIYTKRIYHTWKMRWISSAGLRDGFTDKYTAYMLLLLATSLVDAALVISKAPISISSIVVTCLAITEFISILENLSEAGIAVHIIAKIKDKVNEKLK